MKILEVWWGFVEMDIGYDMLKSVGVFFLLCWWDEEAIRKGFGGMDGDGIGMEVGGFQFYEGFWLRGGAWFDFG